MFAILYWSSDEMINSLESGIKELVEEFVANGALCPANMDVASRREGYVASTVLAGMM
ncbi:hypothetical protein JCM19238_1341 [Vibrio ponticus]|nr:hypothetical protein JCM19238_1341 [Vibrio ponticus]